MAVEKEIVFIVGCPRSGTTFLGKLLREYLDFGFVNELQIIPKFYKKLKKYGDLNNHANLEKLITDILKDSFFEIFQKTYSQYTKKFVQITKEDILNFLPERSYAGIIYAILNAAAFKIGKKRVGSKNPDSYLDIINELFPKAKVIHIIRDGRDCALSCYRLRWGHTNAYMAATVWKFHVSRNKYLGNLLLKDRYIELKYEDLLANPVRELQRLNDFLKIESTDLYTMKQKIESITIKNNCYKWKKAMSKKDIAIFQTVAGEVLEKLGYEIFPVPNVKLSNFAKIYYKTKDFFLREYRYRFRKDLPG